MQHHKGKKRGKEEIENEKDGATIGTVA